MLMNKILIINSMNNNKNLFFSTDCMHTSFSSFDVPEFQKYHSKLLPCITIIKPGHKLILVLCYFNSTERPIEHDSADRKYMEKHQKYEAKC